MAIKKRKPVTSAQRFQEYSDFSEITKNKPERSLLAPLRGTGGRNSGGRITSRHRGGGHKRMYRIIDFKCDKIGIPAKVMSIEYDPNRSGRIALIQYNDGEMRYILAPDGIKIGTEISTGSGVPLRDGNRMPLRDIPEGMPFHNLEMKPGCGGKLMRSAGSSAQILTKEEPFAHIRLPSGEIRLIPLGCFATLGRVSNIDHNSISIGKAGRSRWMGIRPQSRGSVMNPVDHPMGGGEGRSKGHIPQSPTGVPAKGYKTRKKKNLSNRFILKRRKK